MTKTLEKHEGYAKLWNYLFITTKLWHRMRLIPWQHLEAGLAETQAVESDDWRKMSNITTS